MVTCFFLQLQGFIFPHKAQIAIKRKKLKIMFTMTNLTQFLVKTQNQRCYEWNNIS